jgi:hypothetical protein
MPWMKKQYILRGPEYHIYDDFDDLDLERRSPGILLLDDKLLIAKQLRPAWTVTAGLSINSGKLRATGSADGYFSNTFNGSNGGVWELKFQRVAVGGTDNYTLFAYFMYEDSSNYYVLYIQNKSTSPAVLLVKNQAGGGDTTLISFTWDSDTNEHTLKLTRDSSGNWELFYDGVSKGTATDSWLPSNPTQFKITSGINLGTMDLDDIKVYEG